jgi:methyltransferase family protein
VTPASGESGAGQPGYRLYTDLAPWWPLISPPEEYQEEAAWAAAMLRSAASDVREVLELGSGGGNNAWYLKRSFTLTLVDLSAGMLAVSRRLNPELTHHQGDMRSVRLGRAFDAVFVHDAVGYLTSEQDLRLAMGTAFAHCRPGGAAVFIPDWTAETFEPGTSHGGSDDPTGRGARYLEWAWDPGPAGTWALAEFAYLLREADGRVHSVHETHRLGLFSRQTWLRLLAEAGFTASAQTEVTTEDRSPREAFIGRRPAR